MFYGKLHRQQPVPNTIKIQPNSSRTSEALQYLHKKYRHAERRLISTIETHYLDPRLKHFNRRKHGMSF